MKHFILKSTCFILLCLVIQFTPDSFIYFRFWEREGLLKNGQKDLSLPQYTPHLDYTSYDAGDQNHNMNCSVKKPIHWFTDQYGFRNKTKITDATLVLAGCSNTQGCNTDYDFTFSGLLNKGATSVYNCAPDYTLDYLTMIYNLEKPKKVRRIFYVMVARLFSDKDCFEKKTIHLIEYSQFDQSLTHINENHAGRKIKKSLIGLFKKCDGNYHFYGKRPDTTFIKDNIVQLKKKIAFFTEQGLPLTVVILPDKEVYSANDNLSSINLKNYNCIYQNLIKNNIPSINVLTQFNVAGIRNYYHGDGHINEAGHQIISSILRDSI